MNTLTKIELDPNVDLVVNVSDLDAELRKFALYLNRYCNIKADAGKARDIAKAELSEIKAVTYKRIKSDPSVKHTEKSLEAEVETDRLVMELRRKLIDAEHNLETLEGTVMSMCAKKDMLVQISSNRRKEV